MIKQNTQPEYIKNLIGSLPKDTVIGEFSGRDSVAAILKVLEDTHIKHVLPVASLSPTEYGDFDSLDRNYRNLVSRVESLYGGEKKIFPLIYYSNADLWSVINGRLVEYVNRKFGFYTTCIGCHAYLHLVRVPLALKLGKKVISGERESHDGKVKVNQLGCSLETYERILDDLGVELMVPLQKVEDGRAIERLIGWEWQEGKDHPSCIFSGNYRDLEGKALYDEKKIARYLDEFLYKVCVKLGRLIIEDENADKQKMIEVLMEDGDIQ